MIAPNGLNVEIDSDIYLRFEMDHVILFDPETKEYIVRYDEAGIQALSDQTAAANA